MATNPYQSPQDDHGEDDAPPRRSYPQFALASVAFFLLAAWG